VPVIYWEQAIFDKGSANMNYGILKEKRDYVLQNIGLLPEIVIENFENDFIVGYTHDSTAIEGNTLSLIETKLILEDRQSVGGKPLREIYEIVNHASAYDYVKKCIAEKKPLTETAVKDIHEILTANIFQGGIYRNTDVRIVGASHTPPSPSEMYVQVKNFYVDMAFKNDLNPIELAAWTHAEFVRIHPFPDGNGRTSRLLMNYQLMGEGFLPVTVRSEDRLPYFETLEKYATEGDIAPFADMSAGLENYRLDEYIHAIEMGQENNPALKMT
jgi:Fic family protein